MILNKITKVTKEGHITGWRKLEPSWNPKQAAKLGDIVGTSPWGDWHARSRSCAASYLYKYPEGMTDSGKRSARDVTSRILDLEEQGINALRHEARKADLR